MTPGKWNEIYANKLESITDPSVKVSDETMIENIFHAFVLDLRKSCRDKDVTEILSILARQINGETITPPDFDERNAIEVPASVNHILPLLRWIWSDNEVYKILMNTSADIDVAKDKALNFFISPPTPSAK